MTSSRFSRWTFVLLFVISTILVIHLLGGFITPVILAIVIASFFDPVYRRLLRLCKGRDYVAAALATLLVFLCVFVPLLFFTISLVQEGLTLFQATDLSDSGNLFGWIDNLKDRMAELNSHLKAYGVSISFDFIVKGISSVSQAMGKWVYASVGMMAANLLSLGINFILTLVLVFVFFVSGQKAKGYIVDLVPLPDDEKDRLVTRFRDLYWAVFVGNGLVSVIEGVLGGLSFFIFGMSGALIWGVAMFITAFLPMIGASIIVIPGAIYLYLMGKTASAILFLLFNVIQLTVLETLVKPRLISTRSQMHAVLVFMSIIAGIEIYGFFGIFYGPLLVTMFLAFAEIYKEHYRDRLLETNQGFKDKL